MQALIESGRIADLILLILVVEAAVLVALARKLPRGQPLASLLLNLAAGAFLLLGLRAILLEAGWQQAGMLLGLAGLAHAGDLWLRLRPGARR